MNLLFIYSKTLMDLKNFTVVKIKKSECHYLLFVYLWHIIKVSVFRCRFLPLFGDFVNDYFEYLNADITDRNF